MHRFKDTDESHPYCSVCGEDEGSHPRTVFYRISDRGHREFDVAGRRYRAFWMQCGHEWSLKEIGLDGLKIAPEGQNSWLKKNWKYVESFVAWRARESGAAVTELRIIPVRASVRASSEGRV